MSAFDGFVLDVSPAGMLLFRASALLLAACVLDLLLIRRNPRWRVFLWRGTLTGLVVLPAGLFYNPVATINLVGPSAGATIDAAPRAGKPLLMPDHDVKRTIVYCWIAVAGVLFLRIPANALRLRRVTLRAAEIPAKFRNRSESIARDLGCRHTAGVRHAPDAASPYLTGLLRPVVVLPERMVRAGDEAEFSAVLAHEMTHLKSRDIAWLLLGRAIGTVLWFHPLAWRMQSAHAAACEAVCDAVAADYIADRGAYSVLLARTALEACGRPCGGLAMFRGGSVLRRIRNLECGIEAKVPARRPLIASALFGAAFIGGMLSCGFTAPTDQDREFYSRENWTLQMYVRVPCSWAKAWKSKLPDAGGDS